MEQRGPGDSRTNIANASGPEVGSLTPAARAKEYRRLAQDARREAERSDEPNHSYCVQIAVLWERLAAHLDPDRPHGTKG